ncbi:MAG: topoisomerase IV [Tyzzerella sp.]|uniref:Topoisomerase IV n=1 Tax=Candidatus Fimicola merdigallinarum TaxID=2840819 RepID=A0A9D9H4U2_9FIRM|nr:topoisomerase IV [Candidatus Fimicola merdigallinarum]
MARKKNNDDDFKSINIIEQKITDTLELNYMPYAMSVIVSRAIPEIDGFKPSHRKLLYSMYKSGLLNGDRKKSSAVVGETMKLNPHGDAAIYETMVRLTEGNGALLHPFIDSKGNFGKQYSRDMAYAAARYTEVKLSSICNEIFADIDKNTVEFVDNFDASTKEPVLLPTTFPNILVSPNQGIAVGMASSICSFNLREVCNTAIEYIKNENCDLSKTLLAPDLSTGGEIIYSKKDMDSIYETGRGSFKIRSKYRYDSKNSCIEVYEIPYTTNIESIIDKIIQLIKAGKIREITDIRDETDLNGLKIAIDIKRNTKPDMLMQKLFKLTPLQDSFSCNFNLLIKGNPMTLGVLQILREWTLFRMDSIRNQIAFDIKKKSDKKHLLEGLSKILMDIDKAISIIRNTELESDVVPNLMSGFGIDEIQAEYIAEIKLRNINKEYILNRIKELDTLSSDIKNLEETLKSEKKIKDIICKQLKQVAKKYGKDRVSSIIDESEVETVSTEDFIEDYGVRLFLTKENYFKKISLVSLRSSGEQKLKEDDEIIQELETTNKSEILLFSNKCNVYKVKTSDISDTKASVLGEYLTNLLGLDDDERILYMTAIYDYTGFMLFIYESGKASRIPLSAYYTKTNRKKLINAYSSKSPVVYIQKFDEEDDVLIVRDGERASIINTSLVSESSTKSASGIQVYTLKKKSESKITFATRLSNFESDNIDYYRANSIPSAGHILREDDISKNSFLK